MAIILCRFLFPSNHMPDKTRVLIYSVLNCSRPSGAVVCSEDLFINIKNLSDTSLILVSSGFADDEHANAEFARKLGLEHCFLPLREAKSSSGRPESSAILTISQKILRALMQKYQYFYERLSLEQRHIDGAVMDIITSHKPDIVVINGIFSALCVPSAFSLNVVRCYIAHNNEIEIHRDFKLHAHDGHGMARRWFARHGNWISNIRFAKHVNRLYARCTGVIALASTDLPEGLPDRVKRAVLPPLLKESDLKWGYHGNRRVLFVGNISYFANRLAVEWICRKLAPELLQLDDTISIDIIGADTRHVPPDWRLSNINFLGSSDNKEVTRHMLSNDLFIAPTAQNYGAKLKLAECASHGTPFVATDSAMGGVPFLAGVPKIQLNLPNAAAHLLVEYINSPERLISLSRNVTERMKQARIDQAENWKSFINDLTDSARSHALEPSVFR